MSAASKNGSGGVRVAVASASAVRRAGLETLIKSTPSLKLAASLREMQNLAQRIDSVQAEVVVIDLDGQSSFVSTGILEIPVVALVDNPDPAWTAQALRYGVKSILPRDADAEQIRAAILAAHLGLVLLSVEASHSLAGSVRPPLQPPDIPLEQLTPRELEVLGMLSEGLGNRQIADRLGVSDHTIKFHISSILDKLGASTRTEAVTAGLRMGLILL
jgi:NarL family two-component system response regulator YdfI